MKMCLSHEELDSIRALAAASEETEALAKTLYAAVTRDPEEARRRSSDKLRALRVPIISLPAEEPDEVPPHLPKVGMG